MPEKKPDAFFKPGADLRIEASAIALGQLRRAMPRCDAETWHPLLCAAMSWFSIDTPIRAACFLATLAHESGDLRRLEEDLSYTAERILQVWPTRFKGLPDARPYERNPERLANRAYASRMGNGTEASGDGWKYRGRGPIQITGKKNYAAFDKATGHPALAHPEILAVPGAPAADSAAWWWIANGMNELADKVPMTGKAEAQFLPLIVRVNGGDIGKDLRLAHLDMAREALA